jgi:broad specificity phosphatase PhoE
MTQTVVHLLRHGEVYNPTGVLYGRLPGFGLSEAGEQMALQARDALADRDITVVRSSPLQRAVQTAAPTAELFGITPTTDERLIESENFFEGKTFGVGDGSLKRPSVWIHLWNPFRPSWGEPYLDVAKRVALAVADAREAADGHEAVLVSHQLPIEVTRRFLQGETLWHRPDRRQCALASLTSIIYDGDHIERIDYSEPAGDAGRKRVGGA